MTFAAIGLAVAHQAVAELIAADLGWDVDDGTRSAVVRTVKMLGLAQVKASMAGRLLTRPATAEPIIRRLRAEYAAMTGAPRPPWTDPPA